MTAVRWGSLIAATDGEVDYARLRSLTAIVLAWIGGLVLCAVMTGVLKAPTDIVMIGVAALVLPLTGGKIGDAIMGRRQPDADLPRTGGGTPSIP
jgi:hypothetical protein